MRAASRTQTTTVLEVDMEIIMGNRTMTEVRAECAQLGITPGRSIEECERRIAHYHSAAPSEADVKHAEEVALVQQASRRAGKVDPVKQAAFNKAAEEVLWGVGSTDPKGLAGLLVDRAPKMIEFGGSVIVVDGHRPPQLVRDGRLEVLGMDFASGPDMTVLHYTPKTIPVSAANMRRVLAETPAAPRQPVTKNIRRKQLRKVTRWQQRVAPRLLHYNKKVRQLKRRLENCQRSMAG